MKFLIDTNVFIPLEPTATTEIESGSSGAMEFARLVHETGHQLYLHPAQLLDIQRDSDTPRRKLREVLFSKYPRLPDPPAISSEMELTLGRAKSGSNDWVDHCLLVALEADAADYLITEDQKVHRESTRLDLQQRVATVAEAISVVRDLFDRVPSPPPRVQATSAHTLKKNDQIFDSFREDYPGFDAWLKNCRLEHRQSWVIEGDGSTLAGFCIIKQEDCGGSALGRKALKICSFKVSEAHNGFRFGELLLKTVLQYVTANNYDWTYVTVLPKYSTLIRFFEDFGFRDSGRRTELSEIVLEKRLRFTAEEQDAIDPLTFNVLYGPFAVKVKDIPAYVVPIKPCYHRLLFPDFEMQRIITPGAYPFGNSIRKAYLSNAPIRRIKPGDNLLFYRSGDHCSVTSLGVVENTLVSRSPTKIARHVGKRTVYRFDEIKSFCRSDVLAILFRQSRLLRTPISLPELVKNGVLTAAPQTITAVREVSEWLQTQLKG